MTDSYNRDEVVAFWRSTGLENKHKRREIEKLAQLTGAHVDHISSFVQADQISGSTFRF